MHECTHACTLQKPKTLAEAVEQLMAVRLEEERSSLAAQWAAKADALAARIAQLEAAATAAAQQLPQGRQQPLSAGGAGGHHQPPPAGSAKGSRAGSAAASARPPS